MVSKFVGGFEDRAIHDPDVAWIGKPSDDVVARFPFELPPSGDDSEGMVDRGNLNPLAIGFGIESLESVFVDHSGGMVSLQEFLLRLGPILVVNTTAKVISGFELLDGFERRDFLGGIDPLSP